MMRRVRRVCKVVDWIDRRRRASEPRLVSSHVGTTGCAAVTRTWTLMMSSRDISTSWSMAAAVAPAVAAMILLLSEGCCCCGW